MSDDSVRCWGDNGYGQLGLDTKVVTSFTAVPVENLGKGIVQIAAGEFHTCVLLRDSTVQCWGRNKQGQLGVDPTKVAISLVPVSVSGLGDGVTQIAGGYGHTCAALKTGEVLCWGDDTDGQLGDGKTDTLSFAPVKVVGVP